MPPLNTFARGEKDLRTSARERGTSDWQERSGGWQTAADFSGFLPKAATKFKDGMRVLPHFLHVFFVPRISNPNGAGYFVSVIQWMTHDNYRGWRRKAGWVCSCWWCAGR
jgi:hypothetical protein